MTNNDKYMEITKQEYSEVEKQHKARLAELQSMIVWGDWSKVGKKLGINTNNAQQRFKRIHSAHHPETVKAVEEVISERMKNLTA